MPAGAARCRGRRCPDGLALDHQAELRGGSRPAADQETDEVPLDREFLADEPARGVIPLEERVHQPLALEAADGLLAGQRARGGSGSEGLALDPPVLVPVLEVLEHDVGAAGRRRQRLASRHGTIALQKGHVPAREDERRAGR